VTRTILAKAALAALLTSAAALAPAQAQRSQLTAPELNILLGATYGNTNGLQLSQIGAQQAQAPQVRAYAQRSIEQTEQAITDLKALAEKVGVQLPAAPSEGTQRQVHERLKQAQGRDFDVQYMKLASEGLSVALAAHTNAPQVVENEQLDDYARKYAPRLVTALQEAENILQQLEKSSGG
jgi:predicted outer membrane protein